jgi:hypothetical protein
MVQLTEVRGSLEGVIEVAHATNASCHRTIARRIRCWMA